MVDLSDSSVLKILTSRIKSKNSNDIANLLLSNNDKGTLALIIELLVTEDPMTLVFPGDVFKIKPRNHHKNSEFFEDTLIDLGLYDECIYGYITKSDDWGSEHNPYFSSMACNLIYGLNSEYKTSIKIQEIEKVNKEKVAFFNGLAIKNLTNIYKIIESYSDITDTNQSEPLKDTDDIFF